MTSKPIAGPCCEAVCQANPDFPRADQRRSWTGGLERFAEDNARRVPRVGVAMLRRGTLLLGAWLVTVAVAQAQNTAQIGYVYPAGGRQGTTFQVTVGGQFLAGATNVLVSGPGVRASVIEYNRPMNQGAFNDLRDRYRELQTRKRAANQRNRKRNGKSAASTSTNVWTAADEATLAEVRGKLLKNPPNRQGNPAIAETVLVQISADPDAPPGNRELRVRTASGISNPLRFCIGQAPEFSRPAARTSLDPGVYRMLFGSNAPPRTAQDDEAAITLPATANGQILPGAVHRYRFRARQGQQLIVAVHARALIPYLADAVPGWFQATVTLFDAAGRELAYNDDYHAQPDPVLHCTIPATGEYVVEIKDAIYRGREDFVYRMELGELPFITGVFPLGGPAGVATTVELTGWNLPGTTLTVNNRDASAGIRSIAASTKDRISNRVLFVVDDLPECAEHEPNPSPIRAQPVSLPVIVNGRIDAPGDRDVFRFAGGAGDEIVAEVMGRRLGAPLDSVLKLTDASGREIAFNDDYEDKGCGLNTHHADSLLRARLPSDGNHFIEISDVQGQGGSAFAYRLRITAPEPDFELRIVPSSVSLRAGASVPLTVYALRKDGFSNEIAVVLKDAPAGFGVSGGRIPAGQDQVRLTLTAPAALTPEAVAVSLEGRAPIDGREVVRAAVPADDRMQAFAYRHLVPAEELRALVLGRGPLRNTLALVEAVPVKLRPGGTSRIPVASTDKAFANRFELELKDPPAGIRLGGLAAGPQGTEILLECDSSSARPGSAGNLIIEVRPTAPASAAGRKGQANQRRGAVGFLPAIPFEIVAE